MSAKMGFQLSSITPYLDTPESIRHSFHKLAEIGYRDVQLQGVPVKIHDDYIRDAMRNYLSMTFDKHMMNIHVF